MKHTVLFTAMLFAVLVAGCATFGAPVIGCGNGVIEANEACDDGNTKSGDGCDCVCKTEGMEWDWVYDTYSLKDGSKYADTRDRFFAVLFTTEDFDPIMRNAEGELTNWRVEILNWWAKQKDPRITIMVFDTMRMVETDVMNNSISEEYTWLPLIKEAGGIPAMVVHRWRQKQNGKWELFRVKSCHGLECMETLQQFLVENPPEKVREAHLNRR